MTTLQQIRERSDTESSWTNVNAFENADRDRRHLLSLVERMRPYLMHDIETDCMPSYCTCGLDALLEELESE